jgi:signal transduction histidine kinase
VTTTDLYPYLIIIGSSILAATGWLLYQYREQVLRTQELIQLNERLLYDLPDFLRQCWPTLKRGGYTGMQWDLDWFGTLVAEHKGVATGQLIDKHFEAQEIRLDLKLYRDSKGWEQEYFSNALADNFLLLVRMNLWIKLGTVQGAFDQTAKMTVFLKHDVKNMVQLLSLSADQLQSTGSGQEQKVLQSLREAIPAVRDRAEHMLRALSDKPARPQQQTDLLRQPALPLEKILQQAASIYDLPLDIEGQGSVPLEKDHLLSIIDNLLGNYSRQARKQQGRGPRLQIRIREQGKLLSTTIEDVYGRPFLLPERLFEPFWSEHGGGRGIGLYQARQLAKAAGGDLTATATPDKPLLFNLILPRTL